MNTQQFLDYLHDHAATRNLAEEIAYALALRGRRDIGALRVEPRDPQRIAG